MLNPNAIPDGSITQQKIDPSVLAGKQSTLTDTDGSYGQRVAELEKEGIASQEKLTELDQHISGNIGISDLNFSTTSKTVVNDDRSQDVWVSTTLPNPYVYGTSYPLKKLEHGENYRFRITASFENESLNYLVDWEKSYIIFYEREDQTTLTTRQHKYMSSNGVIEFDERFLRENADTCLVQIMLVKSSNYDRTTGGYEAFKINVTVTLLKDVEYLNCTTKEVFEARGGYASLNERLNNLNNNSANDSYVSGDATLLRKEIPPYYVNVPEIPTSFDDDSYIDTKISTVEDGKHILFFTDTHWDKSLNTSWKDNNGDNAWHSPLLMSYVKTRLNIPTVVFGGDFIDNQATKFLATKVLSDFATMTKNAFGRDMLSVMGNHDINIHGADASLSESGLDDKRIPEDITYNLLFKGAKVTNTMWDDVDTKTLKTWGAIFNDLATSSGFSEQKKKRLEAETKMTYFYDDIKNKIRYIILNSGQTLGSAMYDLFGGYYRQFIPWFYKTLMSTPEGYDVCVATHSLTSPYGKTSMSVYAGVFVGMAMGLKAKSSSAYVQLGTFQQSNVNASAIYDTTATRWDFSGANNVGKVFFLVGHNHYDYIAVFNSQSGFTEYDGISMIDQTIVNSGGFINIPVIWTTCDAYARQADASVSGVPIDNPKYAPNREKETISEQAFDVITLQDQAIKITRFGAGYDRQIKIKS